MISHICVNDEFKSETHQQQKEIFACVTFIFVGRGFCNKNGYVRYSKKRPSDKKEKHAYKRTKRFCEFV